MRTEITIKENLYTVSYHKIKISRNIKEDKKVVS